MQPLADGLRNEAYLFQRLSRTERGQAAIRRFLEIGGQTRADELRISELNREIEGLFTQ